MKKIKVVKIETVLATLILIAVIWFFVKFNNPEQELFPVPISPEQISK